MFKFKLNISKRFDDNVLVDGSIALQYPEGTIFIVVDGRNYSIGDIVVRTTKDFDSDVLPILEILHCPSDPHDVGLHYGGKFPCVNTYKLLPDKTREDYV
jgi:hypothetical protein